ncbi:hypothetical protein BN1708_017295 [Verticillium longisporum]|uniref:Uncharacterized protein n=1 Tax=Verticillium longisporum TaxID=100787 RepID=A0A0G4KY60_VERLO|nr:hypothetical protein BN1708_017295 [Verticillium longisporum]
MAPSTAQLKTLSAQFVSLTGASERTAQRYLKNANYKMNDAIDAWGAFIRRTTSGPPPGPPRTAPGPPPRVPPGPQEYPQGRRSTLRTAGVPPGPQYPQGQPQDQDRLQRTSIGPHKCRPSLQWEMPPLPQAYPIQPDHHTLSTLPPDRLPTRVHTVDLGRCIVFSSCRYPLVHCPLVPLLLSTPHHLSPFDSSHLCCPSACHAEDSPCPGSDRHRRSCTRASKEDGLEGHEDCSAL